MPQRSARARAGALLSIIALAAAWALPSRAAPQPGESPGGEPGRVHALVGATVVKRPGERVAGATIVLRDGLVAAVGSGIPIPPDAQVWDLRGYTVYPGLIEPYLCTAPRKDDKEEDEDEDEKPAPPGPKPAARGAAHENPLVRPEREMAAELDLSPKLLEELRGAGFTSAVVVPEQGIFRGQSALVNLRDGSPREQVLRARVAQHLALEASGWSSRQYPNSLMGAAALVRQTLLDTQHHTAAWAHYEAEPMGKERPETNLSLAALAPALSGQLPFCLQAEDTQALLRGTRLLAEFEQTPWVVLGDADCYRWLDQVTGSGVSLVLALNFPPAPTWENEDELPDVDHEALRHWYLAPECPARLERARQRFAFTSQGLGARKEVHARVRQAIERGLSPDAALAAFTTAPAALLRAPQLGVIEPGAIANLTVCAGELFTEGSEVAEVWVDGLRYPRSLAPPAPAEVAGRWRLEADGAALELAIELEGGVLRGTLARADGTAGPAQQPAQQLQLWRDKLTLLVPRELNAEGVDLPIELRVRGPLARGTWRRGGEAGGPALARRLGPIEPKEEQVLARAPLRLQLGPRAPWPPLPEEAPSAVVIKDATVWTEGPQGTLRGASMLIEDGLIKEVGFRVRAPAGALVVAAGGRHLTPGLIDVHSHSFGAGPVNESTNTCTAEVRMSDALDPDAIEIYRQLAGGLTAAQQLHGSANAIGGQSAIVRLRWGRPAHELLFEGATPTIKWALGENPKRSNWGAGLAPRYPTSRPGVLEAIRERLLAARDYKRKQQRYRQELAQGKDVTPPRRDLQLEALVEVLEGKRKVQCHSYRQDEILALIRLAEELGFTIGTFHHVLEGYKVADEIAAHGAGAATFSDWWAYKIEVYDAIAYNAALMHQRGVLVAIKSDSSEMARRLNQEAAKSIRYGGLDPEAALSLVTRNPAMQLGVDASVGTLEPGKQADFVLWSGDPLKTATTCQETWIQGRRYFSRERDRAAYALLEVEREALLEAARRANAEKEEGAPWRPTFPRPGGARGAQHDHHDHHGGPK
ncbi:MAG: amidohydrolase family protein [Planctomycetota bacterium]